jgi:hypothetical protein
VSLTFPEGTPTLANVKLKAILSIANVSAPVLSTEVNAATSVDLSLHFFPEGWSPTAAQGKGATRRRLGSTKTTERLNTTTYSLGALQYIHKPELDDAAEGNEARELLQPGMRIYFLEAQGVDGETGVLAVGDRGRVHYVTLGEQIWSGDQTDENGEYFITQELVYVSPEGPVICTIAAPAV